MLFHFALSIAYTIVMFVPTLMSAMMFDAPGSLKNPVLILVWCALVGSWIASVCFDVYCIVHALVWVAEYVM